MTAPPAEAPPAPQPGTTTNKINGNVTDGVQAHTINGDVAIIGSGIGREDLVVRYSTKSELAEVATRFTRPGGFTAAAHALGTGVVLICGRGTGRSYAARRLLVDRGVATMADLNPERSLSSIRGSELAADHGYVWDLREAGAKPFTDNAFVHCLEVVRAAGCLLVIILDHPLQSCAAAADRTVPLSAPPALDVATALVDTEDAEAAVIVLREDLAEELASAPPERAVRAADLAVRVSRGEVSATDALADLRGGADVAVSQWFEGRSVREHAEALAVALLEHEPVDEVLLLARDLDKRIQDAELPESGFPTPAPVFDKTKGQLLKAIHATSVLRDHPRYPGLREETVRFERQDWAPAVLRHVWREYPAAHPVLTEWMRDPELVHRFPESIRRALCLLVAMVPAHEPLRPLSELADRPWVKHRDLAASTLSHLVDVPGMGPLVKQALTQWWSGRAHQMSTVALFWSTPAGSRDLDRALAWLTETAKSSKPSVQSAVIASVLRLMRQPEHRAAVVATVLHWSAASTARGDTRPVSLRLALYFTGFTASAWFDSTTFLTEFPAEARVLLRRALRDRKFGERAVLHLLDLADNAHRRKKDARTRLLAALSLVTDDLGWRNRRLLVHQLSYPNPALRSRVRAMLRLAAHADRPTWLPPPQW
ncbi:hypothetical protein L6E12_14115 [Actinokineospora sp. PR83]|uniref:hypothetical protein n=1 Tax=Actinokineospora sp. PR83 TaxID=2884908 RepID=UPI001F4671A4|nr:hypothetical protein [Actinokineospora sp. PR83]MCG8916926.1 hypothetical protein [Actinokineospora sp. PR83]